MQRAETAVEEDGALGELSQVLNGLQVQEEDTPRSNAKKLFQSSSEVKTGKKETEAREEIKSYCELEAETRQKNTSQSQNLPS